MKPSLLAASAFALCFSAGFAAAQDTDTFIVEGARPELEVEPAIAAPDGAVANDPLDVPSAAASASVISYTPDYFAPYNPSNANDMVNRVPGFNASGGGNARGFGQNAGNVLINGERPSAKSQDVSDILQRISVGDVVRIDLIRGQTAGIDMGGQTVVVNVIRRVSARASGTWRLQANYNGNTGHTRLNGEVNRTFSLLGANITAGVSRNAFPAGQTRREYVLAPDGSLFQQNLQRSEGGQKGWQANFNADRAIGQWALRLNGRYSDGGFGNEEYVKRVAGISRPPGDFTYPFNFLRYDFEDIAFDNNEVQWELGGDLERDLNSELTLKIIALKNGEKQTGENFFSTYDEPTGLVSSFSSVSENESGESILRSFITWTPIEAVSVEMGAEGAFNFLESTSVVTGQPDSVTRVEEKRAEPYISALWRARPNLTFDAAFQTEFSEISQSGFAERERSFVYPKGHASMTWDARPTTQFRFTIDRSVGQLSFGDFQRSVNLQENTQDAGNPDLVPEQVWEFTAVAEQRFWDDGVFTVEFSRDWIQDAQGQVVIVTESGRVTEGPGNLGDADRWNVEFAVDMPLDRIGVSDARLQADYEYGNSEVVDPVTGEIRELSGGGGFNGGGGRRSFSVDFRKDYPAQGFSWGFGYSNSSTSYSYRLTEVTTNSNNNGGVQAFVETTRFFGLNIRLQVNNLGNYYSDRFRHRFTGPRDVAALGATEWRRQKDKIGVNLRVRGNF